MAGSSALKYDWVFLDKSGQMQSFKPDSDPNFARFRKNLVSSPLPYLCAVLPYGEFKYSTEKRPFG